MQEDGLQTLERAFVLARSGQFGTVKEIQTVLKREGYVYRLLNGAPSLSRQLRDIMKAAREGKDARRT